MDVSGGPTALTGIMMCLALGAWMLGRWQGGLAPHDHDESLAGGDRPEPHAGRPAADRIVAPHVAPSTVTERPVKFEGAHSFGALHAEVSAYRRAEQVLTAVHDETLCLGTLRQRAREDCRYLRLMGELACGCNTCSAAVPRVERAIQPSSSAAGFVRV